MSDGATRKRAGLFLATGLVLVGACTSASGRAQTTTTAAPPTTTTPTTGAARVPPRLDGPFRVVRVVDGDTIKVSNGDTLRLIGMDTPETVDPRKPVQCFGVAASRRAHALLDGQSVSLEYDPSQGRLDKYGRTLAYVWMADGQLFNELMIREGYAHEYTYNTPYKYQARFRAAEAAARQAARGLWSSSTCGGDTSTGARGGAPSAGGGNASARGQCDPSYPTVCIPPPPPNLDCKDVPYRNFKVLAPDPQHFDGNHDGVGCQS
jgi:micrococcal nuclease